MQNPEKTGNRTSHIPVLRPRLPSAESILPYLRRLDHTRIYSNFGPLSQEFETRLSKRLQLGDGCLAVTASGTAGLIASILSVAGTARSDRPYAIVPSFSFPATAIAVERCGYKCFFADVNPDNWTLDAGDLSDELLSQIGLVVPVAPLGRMLPQEPWLEFQERTGIPVVIDAAAGFSVVESAPSALFGPLPVVLSFHATKSFGIGEGGCVISTDRNLILDVRRSLNFGFWNSRESLGPSINGKLSEYHAAVGLAQLDEWDAKRIAMQTVADRYRRRIAEFERGDSFFGFPDIDGSYALFWSESQSEAKSVMRALNAEHIEYRLWYEGIHRHEHFAKACRSTMDVTETLAKCLIGLPMAPDLRREQIARVTAALARVTDGTADASVQD